MALLYIMTSCWHAEYESYPKHMFNAEWAIYVNACSNYKDDNWYKHGNEMKVFWFHAIPLSIWTWFLQFSSLKYPVWWTEFFSQFELDFYWMCSLQKTSLNWTKNPVHNTGYFKLENCKNPDQIDKGYDSVILKSESVKSFVSSPTSKDIHVAL